MVFVSELWLTNGDCDVMVLCLWFSGVVILGTVTGVLCIAGSLLSLSSSGLREP